MSLEILRSSSATTDGIFWAHCCRELKSVVRVSEYISEKSFKQFEKLILNPPKKCPVFLPTFFLSLNLLLGSMFHARLYNKCKENVGR
jgi:hypothetical protein